MLEIAFMTVDLVLLTLQRQDVVIDDLLLGLGMCIAAITLYS